MNHMLDVSGKRFGRLLALWPAGYMTRDRKVIGFACQCDCGAVVVAGSGALKRGRNNSCGCLRRELRASKSDFYSHRLRHGHARDSGRTPEYKAYSNAKDRCTNSKCRCYANYGGRGIEFRFESFEAFFAELGRRPDGLSLERINNNGHYEAGNVKWATMKEQENNRRNNRKVCSQQQAQPV